MIARFTDLNGIELEVYKNTEINTDVVIDLLSKKVVEYLFLWNNNGTWDRYSISKETYDALNEFNIV